MFLVQQNNTLPHILLYSQFRYMVMVVEVTIFQFFSGRFFLEYEPIFAATHCEKVPFLT